MRHQSKTWRRTKSIMKKIKKYHPIVCGIAIVLCFLYFAFFSKNNFKRHRDLNQKIADLESRIEKANNRTNNLYGHDELKNNLELLEKFAREERNLQKENEDVFIIVNE